MDGAGRQGGSLERQRQAQRASQATVSEPVPMWAPLGAAPAQAGTWEHWKFGKCPEQGLRGQRPEAAHQ